LKQWRPEDPTRNLTGAKKKKSKRCVVKRAERTKGGMRQTGQGGGFFIPVTRVGGPMSKGGGEAGAQ